MRILLFLNKEAIAKIQIEEIIRQPLLISKRGGNTGNFVFYNAIYNYINTEYNFIDFAEIDTNNSILNYSVDQINEQFDLVIIPSLIFEINSSSIAQLNNITNNLRGLTIPIICISAGLQVELNDDINYYKNILEMPVKKIVEVIRQSGGEIALRGYETASFFEKIGIKNAPVIGCPSFFQKGRRGIVIEQIKHEEKNFTPCLNGDLSSFRSDFYKKSFRKYPNSEYIDQGLFFDLLIDSGNRNLIYQMKLLKQYGYYARKMFDMGRVKIFTNYLDWENHMKKFSFSIGERIHGNIIALLAGTPSFVVYHDTRTREMADYFAIPNANKTVLSDDIFDIYLMADYTKMTIQYSDKFRKFENFLIKYGAVRDLNHLDEYYS